VDGDRAAERHVRLSRRPRGGWTLEGDRRITFGQDAGAWVVLIFQPSARLPESLPGRHKTLTAAVLAAARWWIDHPSPHVAALIDQAPELRPLLLAVSDEDEAADAMLHDRLEELGVRYRCGLRDTLNGLGVVPKFTPKEGGQ
jgi:hypothetical protein